MKLFKYLTNLFKDFKNFNFKKRLFFWRRNIWNEWYVYEVPGVSIVNKLAIKNERIEDENSTE